MDKGVVAAGHPLTAEAAAIILEAGGNAFDAIIAAAWAACVGEPVLTSAGGGGFMLAQCADGRTAAYDFFVQTPRRRRPESELDFFPIQADFGTTTQEFHIGLGAVATPGMVAGLFRIQRDLGSVPMRQLMEPAISWARQGQPLNPLQAYIFDVVHPIYEYHAESRAVFASRRGPGLLKSGESLRQTALADSLEALGYEGAELFYRGELAQTLVSQSREGGGHLLYADLEGYRVALRQPLAVPHGGARLLFNPPPSSGGALIAFALRLWREQWREQQASTQTPGSDGASADSLLTLAAVMAATNRARERHYDPHADEAGVARRLLSDDVVDQALAQLRGVPVQTRGTSHISVMDAVGNVAALTSSNGEGCGYMVPGSGIMLNNMLGEEDVNPHGFHSWQQDRRLSSMMAPTLVQHPDYTIATGSGGSNRIRSAILQVLIKLIDWGWDAEQAINSPRIHLEGRLLSIEPGFSPTALAALEAAWPGCEHWQQHNLFFGGAHTTLHHRKSGFSGAGDQRRGGVCRVVG